MSAEMKVKQELLRLQADAGPNEEHFLRSLYFALLQEQEGLEPAAFYF
ncbi:hypothetical protein ACTHPF_12245 [Paenibacillus sp. SAF-054]